MSIVCEWIPGVLLGKYGLKDLEYADDSTLFSETADQPSKALCMFNEENKKLSLQINCSKNKLLRVGDGLTHDPSYFVVPLSTFFLSLNINHCHPLTALFM